MAGTSDNPLNMHFRWQHPDPGETDYEAVWALVGASILLVAATWLAAGLPLPPCHFKALTGIPCVTCGATRCVASLGHGDVAAAIRYNPAVFLASAVAGVYWLYATAVSAFKLPRLRVSPASRRLSTFVRFSLLASLAANWLYLIQTLDH